MRPVPRNTQVRTWHALMLAHERVMERLRPALKDLGLSLSEFDVLANISSAEVLRHSELAERVVLSRTALTRLVDRLHDRGLVERQPDPADGRGIRIGLTASGVALRRVALERNAGVVISCFADLDADELAYLQSLARRVGTGVREGSQPN